MRANLRKKKPRPPTKMGSACHIFHSISLKHVLHIQQLKIALALGKEKQQKPSRTACQLAPLLHKERHLNSRRELQPCGRSLAWDQRDRGLRVGSIVTPMFYLSPTDRSQISECNDIHSGDFRWTKESRKMDSRAQENKQASGPIIFPHQF